MSSSTVQSPKAIVTSATKPASSSKAKKPATVKKTVTTKKPATVKKPASKAKFTAKPKATKAGVKATATRPSWKDIIKECIVLRKEDVRQGVSRNTIKKYAEETYKVEVTGTNLYQLNHAISTGAEKGIFVLPKGPSGKIKLAPSKAGGSKENSKPPSAKVETVKKPVIKATPVVKKPALSTKKTLAGKKTTIASKRGAAKKAVTGNAPTKKGKNDD